MSNRTQTGSRCMPWAAAEPSPPRSSSTVTEPKHPMLPPGGPGDRRTGDRYLQRRSCGQFLQHTRTGRSRFGSGHGPVWAGAAAEGTSGQPRGGDVPVVMEPVVMEEEWWRKTSLDGIEMENPERTISESKEDYRRHYVLKILIKC